MPANLVVSGDPLEIMFAVCEVISQIGVDAQSGNGCSFRGSDARRINVKENRGRARKSFVKKIEIESQVDRINVRWR